MPIVDERIEAYTEKHSSPVAAHLEALAAETHSAMGAWAGMMVGPVEGRFLEMLVWASGARRVLEIGSFTGYSAQSMAAALPADGSIVSCDVDEKAVEIARRHLAAGPHGERVEIRLGPALDTVATLPGPFDLVFIDADKANYLNYYEAVLPKLAPRGLIVVDNVLWSGRVLDADPSNAGIDTDTAAIAAFNDHVRADSRVVAVMLPIRDGVTLIRRAS
ncbi:MAG: O-methyltransferase [Acidimicrobiales bacterium]